MTRSRSLRLHRLVVLGVLAALAVASGWWLGQAAQAAGPEDPPPADAPLTHQAEGAIASEDLGFVDLFNGEDLSGWVDVNTSPETWRVEDGVLICTGLPIGVMRSEKQYENFILEIEWRHMEPGGNSGVFVWSAGEVPEGRRLPKGMEVQMLELDWVNINARNGNPQPIEYVHGELFGAGGLTATPDHPRGRRSSSIENRCLGHGQWNRYVVVCVDGTVKLSVNGRFVNSIRDSSIRKGYLCLEAEGAEIQFRKIRIMELDGGVLTEEQTARVVGE